MTYMEFFGCASVAFGPALSMFIFTISHDPVRIIILIASAFFWLLSLLISSFIWLLWPFKSFLFFGVTCSVIFQEFFRYLLYMVLCKAEEGLKKVSMPGTQMSSNKHALSYVGGLGFGIMSGAFALVNILAELVGPGTMGLHKGDPEYFCIVSSIFTMCFIFLHICWGIIFFEAVDTKNYSMFIYVLSTHLLVSYVTLLNASRLYWISMPVILVVVITSASVAFVIAGGSLQRLKVIFSKDSRPEQTAR